MTLRRRIRDALPEFARPLARGVYLRARSNTLLAAAAKRRVERKHTGEERALLGRVSPVIAWNDTMFDGDGQHYFNAGLDAIRVVNAVLAQTGTTPRTILDLPSGWGRATRVFAAQFPGAELTACDIIYDGPRFCAKQFGAKAVESATDFDQLHFARKFDLIFVGSLATHLDADGNAALLRLFARSLTPGGTLVLTTLGDEEVRRFESKGPSEQFDPADARRAVENYWSTGIGYIPYAVPMALVPEEHELLEKSGYGVAFTSPAWLEKAAAQAGFRRVYFEERGWDNLQDIHGLRSST